MNESKKSQAELYLERARLSGLMNEKNEARFLAVAEMWKRPLSAEQMQQQINEHQAEAARREKARPRPTKR